ncbi:MAG: hypothetical protein ABIG89_04310 [Candidatus Woesearchaeota archaeon]
MFKSINLEKLVYSLFNQVRSFTYQYYPEILTIAYASASFFAWNSIEEFFVPDESDITNNIAIRGLESVIVYIRLRTHKAKKNNSSADTLKIPVITGVALCALTYNNILIEDIRYLIGLVSEYYEIGNFRKLIPIYGSIMNPDKNEAIYLPLGFITEGVSRMTTALSLLTIPSVSFTAFLSDNLGRFVHKEHREYACTSLHLKYMLLKRQYAEALELSDQREQMSPEDYRINLKKVSIYAKLNQYGKAFLELKKAEEKLPYQHEIRFVSFDSFIENLAYRELYRREYSKLKRIRRQGKKNEPNIDENEHNVRERISVSMAKEGYNIYRVHEALMYCFTAYLAKVLGKHAKCCSLFEEAVNRFPEFVELKVLYAKELEDLDYLNELNDMKKSGRIHQQVYLKIKEDERFVLEDCGETTKTVVQVGKKNNDFLHFSYVYKLDTEDETKKAQNNLTEIKEKHASMLEVLSYANDTSAGFVRNVDCGKFSRFADVVMIVESLRKLGFPDYLACFSQDDKAVGVMRKNIGATLKVQLFQSPEKAEQSLSDIVVMLAFIHSTMTIKHKTIMPRKEYFHDKLAGLIDRFYVPDVIAHHLNKGYIDELRLQQDYVFNKDAHPENWVIDAGLTKGLREPIIVALDWDEKGCVDQTHELVNLLNTFGDICWKTKLRSVNQYFDAYNYFKMTGNGDSKISTDDLEEAFVTEDINHLFRLSYLNSVYERGIALCYSWSSQSRLTMHQHIRPLMLQMLEASRLLSDEIAHESEYHTMIHSRIKGLERLINYMP